MHMPMHTVAVGAAIGQACLLVAAGSKVRINTDILVHLLARHTGYSVEAVANVMRRSFYMDSMRAKEFDIIDKILWQVQEKIMADAASPEDLDKNAGIKVLDAV